LKSHSSRKGHGYLTTLLVQNDNLLHKVCDPGCFTRDEAIAVAKHVSRIDPLLDTKAGARARGR